MTTNLGQQTFPKVALDVLDANQDDIRTDLLAGFSDRRDAVEWWQRATVLTFGHLADEWSARALLHDRTLLRFLVRSTPIARRARERYHAKWLEPACNQAYNHLKTEAVERLPTNDDDPREDIDPDAIEDPAMRPAFTTLNDRQQQCLDTLWNGFESRDALSPWLHSLNAATYGEIDREFWRRVTEDRVAMRYLLEQHDQEALVYRVRLAIADLLPAFATAAKRLRAGEATQDGDSGPADSFNDG